MTYHNCPVTIDICDCSLVNSHMSFSDQSPNFSQIYLFTRYLRGFGFPTDLLFDLPVRKQILVAASRTLPGPFYRIRAAFMEHLYDQVTMQTHRRMTKYQFCFCGF